MQKPKKLIIKRVGNQTKNKKKKRKKDKLAGLKLEAVLSLSQNNKKKCNVTQSKNLLSRKKKKKTNLNGIQSEMNSSLSSQDVRDIEVKKTEYERPRIKIKKSVEKVSEISKENVLKNKYKMKKKKQSLDRLGEILNKSKTSLKNSVPSLKQFLQGL